MAKKKVPKSGTKNQAGIALIVIALLLIPLWVYILGGLLIWYMYRKIADEKTRAIVVSSLALVTLLFGTTWAKSIISGDTSPDRQTKLESTNNNKTATPISSEDKTKSAPDSNTEQTEIPANTGNNTTEQAPAQSDLYNVVSVVDGDTLKINISGKTETLRLIGIDTPEVVDPRKPVQCFGREASDKAKALLSGKKVRVEADYTQSERDKYDRLLRYVYLEDGTFFNKIMISEGYAHEYTYDSNPYKYQVDFKAAEAQAREQGKGLWAGNTCNGDTSQSATSNQSTATSTTQQTPVVPQQNGSTTTSCIIKGNISADGEKIYHVPGGAYYDKTTIDESKGERWFCSESESQAAGWRKSSR